MREDPKSHSRTFKMRSDVNYINDIKQRGLELGYKLFCKYWIFPQCLMKSAFSFTMFIGQKVNNMLRRKHKKSVQMTIFFSSM